MPLRLISARVQYYRSIVDSGWFDLGQEKTILVGPNEAGKSAVLVALSSLKPGKERRFDPLREFPRHLYKRFDSGELKPEDTPIAQGIFEINDEVRGVLQGISPEYAAAKTVTITRYWDWKRKFELNIAWPQAPTWSAVRADIATLASTLTADQAELKASQQKFASTFDGGELLSNQIRQQVVPWLDQVETLVGADNEQLRRVRAAFEWKSVSKEVINALDEALPKFVYFDNYWRAHARIHLNALKTRQAQGQTEDYDFADNCLLEYLGLKLDELIQLGSLGHAPSQAIAEKEKQLDTRFVKLNAAAIELTNAIKNAWGDELYQLRFAVDGDYLRALATDESGVELELSEKSLGYQWFFSFFTVFYSQARGNLAGALLLLDEPGLHLHALKQQKFREVLSRLSENNQLIYTTHSPFMVGPEEIELARVVETPEGASWGTTVHDSTVAPKNPASFYPLQQALGYALAQSLFGQVRNLCVEGPTDMWYLQTLKSLAEAANEKVEDVAFVPTGGAQRAVVYATILSAQKYKVAVLFDSDPEGVAAAALDNLVKLLPKRSILQVGTFLKNPIKHAEFEDLLRDTLLEVAATHLNITVPANLRSQISRNVLSIFSECGHEGLGFKTRLTKAFMEWAKTHSWDVLSTAEREQASALFAAVGKALK